jgi:RNA polymerase sigma-70 factor, ECF subfamily
VDVPSFPLPLRDGQRTSGRVALWVSARIRMQRSVLYLKIERMETLDRHERFMRLLVSHQPKIYAAIRALGLSRHDAEDVLQNTATVLWRRFDDFREGTRFDHWACQTARLQTLNFRQKRHHEIALLDQQTMQLLVADAEQNQDCLSSIHEHLDDCLERLVDSERSMLDERFIGGRTNAEIGSLLRKSEATISRGLSRVYNKLLACIERNSQPSLEGRT